MMLNTIFRTLATTFVSMALMSAAVAEDAHHPPTSGASAQSGAPSSAPPPTMSQGQGTPGAMPGGPGMMGQSGGAASGGMMPMMGMMGQGGMGMMNMMGRAPMSMPGMDIGGLGMIDRIEGRIAFLRAELKISEAQVRPWNEFADALRANAKRLGEIRATIMAGRRGPPAPLTQRLDMEAHWLAARLEGVRKISSTLSHLYGSLSNEQKKTAEELLGHHLAMLPMGMMPMGVNPDDGGNR